MSQATKPAQPGGIPQDPNTGPEGPGLQDRMPGKGRHPTAHSGTDQMSAGVPGAFGDGAHDHGAPKGDEVTDETNWPADETLPPANSANPPV